MIHFDLTLAQIAHLIDAELIGDGTIRVSRLNKIDDAQEKKQSEARRIGIVRQSERSGLLERRARRNHATGHQPLQNLEGHQDFTGRPRSVLEARREHRDGEPLCASGIPWNSACQARRGTVADQASRVLKPMTERLAIQWPCFFLCSAFVRH